MPEGEEMFKFHGYSGPCPGPRTRPMGGVPEVIELHGEKWVRIDVVQKREERLAEAEAKSTEEYRRGFIDGLKEYAWWKDGVQYVGSCGTTLEQAIERAAP